jgi:hypothetical protein
MFAKINIFICLSNVFFSFLEKHTKKRKKSAPDLILFSTFIQP